MGENRGIGANCGGKEKMKQSVQSGVWLDLNKERQGNGEGALISGVIIKRRDPLQRPISNQCCILDIWHPDEPFRHVCLSVCVWVAVAGNTEIKAFARVT